MAPTSAVQELRSFRGLKVVKSCSWEALPIHLCSHFCGGMYPCHSAQRHRQTDRQTDDGIVAFRSAISLVKVFNDFNRRLRSKLYRCSLLAWPCR